MITMYHFRASFKPNSNCNIVHFMFAYGIILKKKKCVNPLLTNIGQLPLRTQDSSFTGS